MTRIRPVLAPLLLAVLAVCVTCARQVRTDQDTGAIPGPRLGESTATGPASSREPLPDATGPIEISAAYMQGRSTIPDSSGGDVAPAPAAGSGSAQPPAAAVPMSAAVTDVVASAVPPPGDAAPPLPGVPADASPLPQPGIPPDARIPADAGVPADAPLPRDAR